MNFRSLSLLVALSIPVALVACSSAPDVEDEEAESTEEALTARQTLQGTWKDANGGLDLRPSGQFFWEKDNGDRQEGSWSANKRYTKLTLTVDGNKTVYRYIHTPAIVANGFPGPNGLPSIKAKLELQQLIPMTFVAVVHKLTQTDSWCSSAVDCMLQKQDGTWDPPQSTGSPTCKQSTHSCAMGPSATDTVVASCGPAQVLNGFVLPQSVWHAQIIRHQPIILNGFALPSYKVVVKQGANLEAELARCTGNLDDWDLRCTPGPNAPLGVSKVFELSDEPHMKGTYKTGVISPTAPVETHNFRCTLEN